MALDGARYTGRSWDIHYDPKIRLLDLFYLVHGAFVVRLTTSTRKSPSRICRES